jgi:hypothetical protein
MPIHAKSLFAETYVVSSSVTSMSIAYNSGSTIFGDSSDDTHQFTGSAYISGSVTIGNGLTIRKNDSAATLFLVNATASLTSGDTVGQVEFTQYDAYDSGEGPRISAVADSNYSDVGLRFSTHRGGTGVIERMNINYNGAISMGDGTNGSDLHVYGNGAFKVPSDEPTSVSETAGLRLYQNTWTAGKGANLIFGHGAGTSIHNVIRSHLKSAGGSGYSDLRFYVKNSASDSALTPSFTLQYNGHIGIGPTSPSEALHISGSGTTKLFVEGDVSGSSTSTGSFGTMRLDYDNLPTSDPSVKGAVWRDGTDLKISAG